MRITDASTQLHTSTLKMNQPLIGDIRERERIGIAPMGLLLFTIILEVSGTILLRHAQTDGRLFYIPAYIFYFSGFTIFSFTLRYIPLTVAYTTWCALGTTGVTVASQYLYNEEISLPRWVCIIASIPLVVGMYIF